MERLSVPDQLLPLLGVLRRAYPAGVRRRDYLALLDVLQFHMSERSLATIVAALTGREPIQVAADSAVVSGSPAGGGPDSTAIWRVRRHLEACGWDEVAHDFENKDLHARLSPVPEQPDYLLESLAVLRRAYPDGVPGADYQPLLAALWRDCSLRGLSCLVGAYTGRHYVYICNDAEGVSQAVTRSGADRVWQRLLDNGWIPELPVEEDWPPLRPA